MGICQICGNFTEGSATLCQRCELSLFQVTEILETYIKENPPPDWLVEAIGELSWIFREYPRTKAYLNTAMEVIWIFILDEVDEVDADEIIEVNYTVLARDRIISLLEEALIVRRKDGKILPGSLVEKIRDIRWGGYELNTPEMKKRFLEIQGILAVSLIRALIRERTFIPRRAIAVLHVLSANMMRSGEQINPVIPEEVYEIACVGLTSRQKKHIEWIMCGFLDGQTKIINDVTDKGLSLKDTMIMYSQKMRERWRTRERERE